MRLKFLAAFAALSASAASAIPPLPVPPVPPKLLVVISVDQFSADLWDEYRPQFTRGLARIGMGTVFRNGYQSHGGTETCPGHSTLLTGDRPATTGIIANYWTDQTARRSDKSIYCAEDERVPGTSSSSYKVSDTHLRVPTLGDRMKAAWPASRNVAVAGKDRSAVMMSGHHADQRWYWDGKQFSTDLAGAARPQVIGRAHAAVQRLLASTGAPLQPPAFCSAKARRFTLEGSGRVVGDGTLGRAAGDVTGFRASPALDAATLALAAGLVQEMSLGRGPTPDILSVSLAGSDYVGHTYGAGGQEMCLQLLELDREIGDFLTVLDRSGIDYAVVLTADHGGLDIPERQRGQGVADAARVDPKLSAAELGRAIGQRLGLPGPILIGDYAADIYIDHHLRPSDHARVLREALAAYRAHRQVAGAFPREALAAIPMPTGSPDTWTLIQRLRASFDGQRSGDIIVALKPHITPIVDTSGSGAWHGSPWDYDRRVPIAFWRKGTNLSAREEAVETVDIMPTLASMIGLPVSTPTIDGHCLQGVLATVCP